MHTRPLSIAAIILSCFVMPAIAQLGPTPNEIPVSSPVVQTPVQGVPSDSERARPAIDELLLSKARSQQEPATPDAQPVGMIERDLRASEPLVANSQMQTPATLIGGEAEESSTMGLPSLGDGWGQTIIALGGVLLLILGIAQFYKRLARSQGGLAGQIGAGGSAPSGILEVIGRYPIGTGMTMVVLKFDRRVLLVASSAATRGKHAKSASMQTLCELTEPEEVASVLLKARSASGETIARSFEHALQDADDLTDESIYRYDEPARMPARPQTQRSEPVRTITTDEGDRAELWSSGTDGHAAANVLRQRLAAMRRGNQHA